MRTAYILCVYIASTTIRTGCSTCYWLLWTIGNIPCCSLMPTTHVCMAQLCEGGVWAQCTLWYRNWNQAAYSSFTHTGDKGPRGVVSIAVQPCCVTSHFSFVEYPDPQYLQCIAEAIFSRARNHTNWKWLKPPRLYQCMRNILHLFNLQQCACIVMCMCFAPHVITAN